MFLYISRCRSALCLHKTVGAAIVVVQRLLLIASKKYILRHKTRSRECLYFLMKRYYWPKKATKLSIMRTNHLDILEDCRRCNLKTSQGRIFGVTQIQFTYNYCSDTSTWFNNQDDSFFTYFGRNKLFFLELTRVGSCQLKARDKIRSHSISQYQQSLNLKWGELNTK